MQGAAADHAPSGEGAERAATQGGLLRRAVEQLEAGGIEDARRNAEWMLTEVLGESRAVLYAYPERGTDGKAEQALARMVARRLRGEPLQYILGHTAFYGLRLRVTPDVFIPRPETEQFVEEVLRLLAPVEAPAVLDVGTGSGCIALALLAERPDAAVYACDASAAALEVATANARAHDLDVHFVEADALAADFPEHVPASLDLLASNPPYIPRPEAPTLPIEVHGYEPALALFCGEDPLLFYRALARHATRLLRPGGLVAFEGHADYAGEVHALLAQAGFVEVQTKKDLAGRSRIIHARRPR